MSSDINIVASSDDNYAQHVGVMFHSLLSNTETPHNIKLFLINDRISQSNLEHLNHIANQHKASLTLISAKLEDYVELPLLRHGLAAYQRISLPDYLPATLKKIIYLDADTLVLDDIKKLWDIPLEGKPLAAVENLSPKACKILGFKRQGYFNSGVLVTDLEFWKTHNIKNKTIDFINKHSDIIKFADQCGLNHAFHLNWKKLPLNWNQQGDIFGVLKKYAEGCGYSREEMKDAIVNPGVVHFIGTQKPWLWNCFSPYKKHYQVYLSQTPWKDSPYMDNSFANKLKYYLSLRKRARQWLRQQLAPQIPR